MAQQNDDGRPVNFALGLARRVVKATRHVESQVQGTGGGRLPSALINPGIRRARVTVAIPSGTEADPSDEGRVRLKRKNAAGAWVDDDEAVTVWCDFGVTGGGTVAPVGRMVRVSWIAGEWWIVSGSCT